MWTSSGTGDHEPELSVRRLEPGSSLAPFFYELLDELPQGDMGNHFGLFHSDGIRPKPAARAIHNLTTILADTGRTRRVSRPIFFSYSLSGMPTTGFSMLLQEDLGCVPGRGLERAEGLERYATKSPVEAPASPVAITLRGVHENVALRPAEGRGADQELRPWPIWNSQPDRSPYGHRG